MAAAGQNRMWQFVGLAYDRQGQENSGYATNGFINRLTRDAGPEGAGRRRRRGAAGAGQREPGARRPASSSTPSFLIGRTGGTLSRFQPSDLTPGAFIPTIDKELGR